MKNKQDQSSHYLALLGFVMLIVLLSLQDIVLNDFL